MSDVIVISCPVCRVKLRLRGSVLSKATVPCPKCGTTLDVPESQSSESASKRESPPAPPARAEKRPTVSPPQKSGSAPGSSETPKRKRRMPAEEVSDPFSEDLFAPGSAENFGSYTADEDPYGTAAALPPKRKSGSRSAAAVKEKPEKKIKRDGSIRSGGFLSWLGFGMLAAIAGIILQTLLGFTNHMWPLLLATIATGSLVGTAVRFAAGVNQGWGPGITAVLIAAFAIFAGRVGAFTTSPDVNRVLGILDAPLTPEEAEARVAKESTDVWLIAEIAEEVEYDEDFLTSENLDEDDVSEFWMEHADDEDPAKQYHPAVWTEATNRWNKNSPEQKETIRKAKEAELRESYGIMTDAMLQQRIDTAINDDSMIEQIANMLYEDTEWLNAAEITEEQLNEHSNNANSGDDASPESRHLPAIWAEAKRRWEEMSAEDKQAKIQTRSDSLRKELVFSANDAKDTENVSRTIRIFAIVFGALFTLFWGLGSLFCSVSALIGAFKIGSGMSAAE